MELNLSDLFDMQRRLQERYIDKWGGLSAEIGRNKLLWALIETGEAADIIKKRGDQAILNDPAARHDFIEEIGDTIMYLIEALQCYDVSPKEFAEIYRKKFERNMNRW